MANSMICSWILNVIDPKLRTSTAYVDNVELMWKNMKKWYVVSNALKIHQLKTELVECKQGGLEVVEFYSKIMGLWSELENQVRFPRYSCGKCECKIGEELTKMWKRRKLINFWWAWMMRITLILGEEYKLNNISKDMMKSILTVNVPNFKIFLSVQDINCQLDKCQQRPHFCSKWTFHC